MRISFIAFAALLPLTSCVFTTGAPGGEYGLECPAIRQEDHIVMHSGYVSSYNTETLIPNWVAYELTAEETYGPHTRSGLSFTQDPDGRFRQASQDDYSGSGWTRGHMAPAGDMQWDARAMEESFYFVNCCPQNEKLNSKDWQFLEKKVRYWAKKYGSVYVVTGPIIGKNIHGRIGASGVVVPDGFYKALLTEYNGKWKSIAFVMGNDKDRYFLQDCSMSVNRLEKMTGLDFFPALDDSVEESVEDQNSPRDWGLKESH